MERIWFFAYLAILFVLVASSSTFSTSISDGDGDGVSLSSSLGSTTRHLLQLQQKKACPVNFEFMNYTIITSQCKGPQYPANTCCAAFKKFAFPYTQQINDLTTDCASMMFFFINLYGKYPPGLFADKWKEGLECPQSPLN